MHKRIFSPTGNKKRIVKLLHFNYFPERRLMDLACICTVGENSTPFLCVRAFMFFGLKEATFFSSFSMRNYYFLVLPLLLTSKILLQIAILVKQDLQFCI